METETPDTVTAKLSAQVTCPNCAAVGKAEIYDLTCPIRMFEAGGETEYKLHRSTFLTYFANVYDELIGNVRKELSAKFPDREFPEREKLGIALIDMTAIHKVMTEEEPDDAGIQDADESGVTGVAV